MRLGRRGPWELSGRMHGGRGGPWHMRGGESAGLPAASPESVVLRIATASAYQVPGTALGW